MENDRGEKADGVTMMETEKRGSSLKRKIRSRKGDSIAEVLIALLISSLALVMLASMISSSGRMITTSQSVMEKYYAASSVMNNLNGETVPSEAGAVITGKGIFTIEISPAVEGSPTEKKEYPVAYAENQNFAQKPVTAFRKASS